MEVLEIYAQAVDEFKAENFDATLKLLDDINRRDPAYRKAYLLESCVWNRRNNYVKELTALTKCLSLINPADPAQKSFAENVLSLFSDVCYQLGMHEERIDALLLAANFAEDNADACNKISSAIFSTNCLEKFSADDFRALYGEYKKHLADVVPYPKKFYDHRKIRVGFLSADFKAHVVLNWSWNILTALDKNFFEVYCYSNVKNPDGVTDYLSKVVDGWRNIFNLTDEQAAKIIRDDEIDILFDLGGHTSFNRLRVMAYRPASVQMSGIGYINSTGLDCVDYFLSDVHCAGNATAMREYFTEKIILLPQTHFCYEPSDGIESAPLPPCLKNNFVTFGSFNKFSKITDTILSAWAKILDAVPNSRLLLKNIVLDTDDGKTFVANRLKNCGIDVAQVEMRGYSNNHPIDYNDMDIALDTFPYTGCVTTIEALYMGVPVVSLYSNTHGTRIGYSILKNLNIDALAVDKFDDYVARAVELANDWNWLADLRKNLRGMMKRSPLMNSANYVRAIETTFAAILNAERTA